MLFILVAETPLLCGPLVKPAVPRKGKDLVAFWGV